MSLLQQSQPSGQLHPPTPNASAQPPTTSSLQNQLSSFQQSLDLLQAQNEQLHRYIQTLIQNQTSFQNHITAQLQALHSTVLAWTGLGMSNPPSPHPPISSPHPNYHPSPPPLHYHSTPFSLNHFHSPNQHQTDLASFQPPNLNLPRFNGEDAVGWLAMAERYLRVHKVPLHERVLIVGAHLGPDASLWMNAFESRHPAPSWDCFVSAFLDRFGGSCNTTLDLMAQLSHLQHHNTVDEYITEFTKLSCRAPGWTDTQLIPIFCGGLKPELRHGVLAMDPHSLAQAKRLARIYEAKLQDIRGLCAFNFDGAYSSTHGYMKLGSLD